MALNLQDWLERRLYFSGLYYQRGIEQLLLRLVRGGDQFVDIGANIGIITLVAASRFGPTGRGYAFEPNPEAVARLEQHVQMNRLNNVQVMRFALSSRSERARLCVPGTHSGAGTVALQDVKAERVVDIETRRGDDALRRLDPQRAVIIKVDVEGFECHVLRGMPQTLALPNVALVVEVANSMLRQAGDSAHALYGVLNRQGYAPYVIDVAQERWTSRLQLVRTDEPANAQQYDALFVKPHSDLYRSRVEPLLVANQ